MEENLLKATEVGFLTLQHDDDPKYKTSARARRERFGS